MQGFLRMLLLRHSCPSSFNLSPLLSRSSPLHLLQATRWLSTTRVLDISNGDGFEISGWGEAFRAEAANQKNPTICRHGGEREQDRKKKAEDELTTLCRMALDEAGDEKVNGVVSKKDSMKKHLIDVVAVSNVGRFEFRTCMVGSKLSVGFWKSNTAHKEKIPGSTQLPFWKEANCNTRLVPFVHNVKELSCQIHGVCYMSTSSKWGGNHAVEELEDIKEVIDNGDPDLYMHRRYDQSSSSGTESEDDEVLGCFEGPDQHGSGSFSEIEGWDDEGGTDPSHDEYDSDSSNETENDDSEGQAFSGFPHQYGAGSSGETESDSDEWQAVCQGLDRLQQLKPNTDGKYEKLIDILCDPLVLEAAYERIKSRCGSISTKEYEQKTLYSPDQRLQLQVEDPGHSWFESTAEQLRLGTYVFKPAKQVDVRRAARSRATKQLSVIRLRDQIMQEAIRTILEWIYEPMFSEHAHGFRPGKGVHSALRSIKKTWRGVSWFLQFNVQKSDDTTLIQRRLMRVLSERIDDKCFMDILKQMFKVGIVCVDIFADEEIPQGSLLSPILGNIYLMELDEEVAEIMKEFDSDPEEYKDPQRAEECSVGREDRGGD